VEAQLQANGSEQSIKAQWLIACDGMHSTVREQSGIAFSGGEYEASFVLADVSMNWPLSREEVTLFYSPKGLVVVAPLPNERFRIVATVDEAPDVPSREFMQAVLDARGPTTNPGMMWPGVRDFISITVWRKPRATAAFSCAETPRTFTVPPADRA
jgi:2-polyprenyl-6-methoxyphenol hydroxylase-like FAD-dependent oxidoreductase